MVLVNVAKVYGAVLLRVATDVYAENMTIQIYPWLECRSGLRKVRRSSPSRI